MPVDTVSPPHSSRKQAFSPVVLQPCLSKEEINLSLNGDALTIKAVRHSGYEEEAKRKGYLRCERSYGTYARSFDVTGVDTNGIRAAYQDGVLTVTLPKRSAHRPEGQTITIE